MASVNQSIRYASHKVHMTIGGLGGEHENLKDHAYIQTRKHFFLLSSLLNLFLGYFHAVKNPFPSLPYISKPNLYWKSPSKNFTSKWVSQFLKISKPKFYFDPALYVLQGIMFWLCFWRFLDFEMFNSIIRFVPNTACFECVTLSPSVGIAALSISVVTSIDIIILNGKL